MSSPTRPLRQEQEPASTTVTEVAPGILRLQLPISLPGLGHVNCYALEDGHGVTLVDPGLPGIDSWNALQDRLGAAGIPLRRVHTVVVTHSHPDHYGGANQLRRETGADIVGHDLFRSWWDPGDDRELEAADPSVPAEPAARRAPLAMGGGTAPWGSVFRPPDGPPRMTATEAQDWMSTPVPTVRLAEADTITLAGREWVAVHTPGHTPDHLCLFDPTERVLLSGDHVLPSITPHISGVGAGADPLAGFFASLERMHAFDGAVDTVLPAHGAPFGDLGGRVDAIRDHHVERLTLLAEISARLGPASVADLSHELFKPRSWGPMAESETYAHLEHLRLAGRATHDEVAGLLIYRVA